jgi:hypothetical protein
MEKMVATLTSLLKKKAFVWTEVAKHAFLYLKDAMCTTPVLIVPYFTNTLSWNVMPRAKVLE